MNERRRAKLDDGHSGLSAAEGGTISGRRPMARVLSGIQPSGDVHLGNYVGALRN